MTREERNQANKIFKLIDGCITPEVVKAYKHFTMGYLTADDAIAEITLNMFREAERQRAALYKYQ